MLPLEYKLSTIVTALVLSVIMLGEKRKFKKKSAQRAD
jgi:hypothetical protein